MTEIIYQNIQNPNKYLNVVRYACGHYYVVQYLRWEADETPTGTTVVNYTGCIRNRRCRRRWRIGNLKALLEDYRCYEVLKA